MYRRWGLASQDGELSLGHTGQHLWAAMDVGGGAAEVLAAK